MADANVVLKIDCKTFLKVRLSLYVPEMLFPSIRKPLSRRAAKFGITTSPKVFAQEGDEAAGSVDPVQGCEERLLGVDKYGSLDRNRMSFQL